MTKASLVVERASRVFHPLYNGKEQKTKSPKYDKLLHLMW